MGAQNGRDIAAEVEAGTVSLRAAMSWHLSANHYPPVPQTMVPVCIAALDAARAGEWEREIELPEGISWRDQPTAPASAIVEQHHLDDFLLTEATDVDG